MKYTILEKPLFRLKLGTFNFAPRLIPTLMVLLLLPVLLRLGWWQLDRAQEKRDLTVNLQAKATQEPMGLVQALASSQPDQTPVVILGQPLNQFFLVIDNQKQGNRLGYEVLALFQPENYQQPVLVSRGWLPRKDFYQKVPEIPEFKDPIIKGSLYFSKGANAVVAANAQWENFDSHYLIGQFDMQTVKEKVAQMGYHIAPFVVRQQAEPDSPFVRYWPLMASPPQKHTAYAVQWFGMALAVLIIFIVVNSKRVRHSKEDTAKS
ncbi:SURF1 family protein [Kangiella sp. TOML190]|uniref:SURF1 family protein n=1 Tax=Kangiella sp. TOML190 TaxID=2931351 RepID=UPI00203E826A|nr:SURF1 family protein [Kangiella sp. TOML190]